MKALKKIPQIQSSQQSKNGEKENYTKLHDNQIIMKINVLKTF